MELGCAEGANLLAMAYHLPESEFVGVDAHATHIARAQEGCDRLGLRNVRFVHADIASLGDDIGMFDYVLCHGVLSWVDNRVRARIWTLLRDHLAPEGVGYLSYNAGPGWALRGALRNALRTRAMGAQDVASKVSRMRQLLGLLATSPFRETTYGAYLAEEAQLLSAHRDAYLVHEHLAEDHRVFSYREISEAAAEHRLSLTAELSRAWVHREIEEGVRSALREVLDDPIESEELADLALGRTFRISLVTRLGTTATPSEPVLRLERECWIAAPIRPLDKRIDLTDGTHQSFATPDGAQITAKSAVLKAALWEIGRRWPNALAFDELSTQIEQVLRARRVFGPEQRLDDDTLRALRADVLRLERLGHVELRLRHVRMAGEVGPVPRVSRLNRVQAEHSVFISNPHHRLLELDEVGRQLVLLLDGSRDRDALLRDLASQLRERAFELSDESGASLEGEPYERALRQTLEDRLLALAIHGFLEA
jgi:trans-aconitate methyltransferase